MSWSTPGDAVSGGTITAAFWNNTYKNDIALLYNSLATTAGDTFYATGANAITRLAAGTQRQVYRVNSGATAPEWATYPPSGLLYKASGTLTPSSDDYPVLFPTADFLYDITNPAQDKLVINTTGLYIVFFSLAFPSISGTARAVVVEKWNSTCTVLIGNYGEYRTSEATSPFYFSGSCIVPCTSGEILRLHIKNANGVTGPTCASRADAMFGAVLVAA